MGSYEYVVATGPVAGGNVPIQGANGGGLINSYNESAATSSQGQATYEVIRVPQYSQATIGAGLTAKAWDGSTGGILAIDVAGSLNLNNSTVSVDGLGFRGGGSLDMSGTGVLLSGNSDYVNLSTAGCHGSKGEGTAGTPEWVYNQITGLDVNTGQAFDGYPGGSFARGAPGNAGGGATDNHSWDNTENAGGGGGGNGGVGGLGGNCYDTGLPYGGLGGAIYPASVSQMVMGGGGGAGDQNNSPDGASSGGTGGGMIFVRACTVTGSGTFSANGLQGVDNPSGDGAGGGGAGGSVMVAVSQGTLSGLTVSASGGRGANDSPGGAWLGPGGGGGGGVILLSAPAAGTNVNGAIAGVTGSSTNFGAQPGQNGWTATNITIANADTRLLEMSAPSTTST